MLRLPDPDIWWVTEPSDQTTEFGAGLNYEVDASAFTYVDDYWINDTTNFAIDGNGLITSVTQLVVSTYGLQVWANDSLDNRINANFSVTVEDTTNPQISFHWGDQSLQYDEPFTLTIEANDTSGIDHWTISDTENFTFTEPTIYTIDLTNATFLQPGDYPLNVTVFDPYDNTDFTFFTITVDQPDIPPPPPPIPGFPIEAIAIGLVLSVSAIFLVRRHKRKIH